MNFIVSLISKTSYSCERIEYIFIDYCIPKILNNHS